MTRTLLCAGLLVAAACTPKEPGGKAVVAAESTVPTMDSLPPAQKASPIGPQGAPAIDPAHTGRNQLGGTSWEWLYTQTPVEKLAAPDPAKYVLTFGQDGRVSGKADCNRIMGSYEADATQLHMSPLATTRMMCPEGGLGDRFAKDLGFVASYAFHTPDTLRLDMQADGGTFTLRRAR